MWSRWGQDWIAQGVKAEVEFHQEAVETRLHITSQRKHGSLSACKGTEWSLKGRGNGVPHHSRTPSGLSAMSDQPVTPPCDVRAAEAQREYTGLPAPGGGRQEPRPWARGSAVAAECVLPRGCLTGVCSTPCRGHFYHQAGNCCIFALTIKINIVASLERTRGNHRRGSHTWLTWLKTS